MLPCLVLFHWNVTESKSQQGYKTVIVSSHWTETYKSFTDKYALSSFVQVVLSSHSITLWKNPIHYKLLQTVL